MNFFEFRKLVGKIATDHKSGAITKEQALESLQNLNWDGVIVDDESSIKGKEYLHLYVTDLINVINNGSTDN